MHREYSFLTHTLNFGDKARTGTNPATGETVVFPIDNGLTDDEVEAVQDLFDDNGIDGPEPDCEGYSIYGDDGSYLRFRCHDLDAGEPVIGIPIELVTPALTDEILTIILDATRVGNLALTSGIGKAVRLTSGPPSPAQLKRWPDAATITSIIELRHWLINVIGSREVTV